MELVEFKICNSTRKIKKIIIAEPKLSIVISKGNIFNNIYQMLYLFFFILAQSKDLTGTKLLSSIDGFEVDDDEVLTWKKKNC